MHTIIQGDCIEGMKQIPDASVHCVVTSPPYYGLRDYGTATWEGGDAECNHVEIKNTSAKSTLNNNKDGVMYGKTSDMYTRQYKDVCAKCNATRIDQQIGLEESPEAYVARLVDVFREVRRILRDDGTVWLNLGDSYNGNSVNRSGQHGYKAGGYGEAKNRPNANRNKRFSTGGHDNLKPKDLIGIPWRVAFALQADGWYLRQDIIWHKPNPMPESVTDRCTKSHEYIFLLSKSARYYFDHEAIKEPSKYEWNSAKSFSPGGARATNGLHSAQGSQWNGTKTHTDEYKTGRNKRSVWTVATRNYKGAHFATFPTTLIEPCVLAGCPVGGTVFDPFTGSGTTAFVALSHNRHFVGTELNPEYIGLAEERIQHYLNQNPMEL
jgi:DNA modification methylase